jgi:glycosyltransferase involved in cell wall biosynthesis
VKASLIISTYNWKEALRFSLRSALYQTHPPDEIIIADDGSREDTRDLVYQIASGATVPIYHVWQEDRGYRLAMIRNKAIGRATGDYIIFIDGDIILDKDFIQDHKQAAKDHFFSIGPRVILTQSKTARIFKKEQFRFSPFEFGLKNRKNSVRSSFLSNLFSRQSIQMEGIRGSNLAFWRADAVAVNGFNEDFVGWGREDSEFAARLMNWGVQRQTVRFGALTFHLFHPANPRDSLERNDRILEQAIQTGSTWCINGIDKRLPALNVST